jgi:hypothetical protein
VVRAGSIVIAVAWTVWLSSVAVTSETPAAAPAVYVADAVPDAVLAVPGETAPAAGCAERRR